MEMSDTTTSTAESRAARCDDALQKDVCRVACPVCGGALAEIRHKLHCTRCHSIVETCCEGGRG